MVALVFWVGAAFAQQVADEVQPEAASPVSTMEDQPVVAQDWMVVAANPYAVMAGADILRRGGTAADALVAVQLVLGLVEPQSSGLGGGAFLIWYDKASGKLTTLDGRETAPLAATPRLFQGGDGQPLRFFDAVIGGRSVGTPGTPALLHTAHKRWGRLKWGALFAPASALAQDGFVVSPRLAGLVARDAERLQSSPITAAYFLPDGVPIAEGQVLRNPAYALTLKTLAEDGVGAFYAGDLARTIVATVKGARGNPGVLSEIDMAIYRVVERTPVCAAYRGHDVCGMGPPSSGALAVGQTLGMLERFDLSAGPDDAQVRRLIGDASRLAFADRGRYVADNDFVPVPIKGMLDQGYLARRAELLEGQMALEEAQPGAPAFDHALNWADDEAIEMPSTSHISIVDSYGNVASMTTTIENAFGSRLMVGGFLLNNELTDFSFRSHRDGVPVANRVEPGKRPRSSMAPTIVMKDGGPVLVLGSPGGSRIIGYVTQAIIAVLDWGLGVQEAAALPHAVNRFGRYDLEAGTQAEGLAGPMEALGYEVSRRDLTSGLHIIAIGDDLRGGADPRREGIAIGD